MTKKISPARKREQEFEKITGLSCVRFLTAVVLGAAKVKVDPEFKAWCEVREERRKSLRASLNKALAQKIVWRKFGRDVLCVNPDSKKYVFAIVEHLASGSVELGRGPSWEAAIDAAVKAKRGEQ